MEERAQALARSLIFCGLCGMCASVFFSPLVLAWRRRHLRPAGRRGRTLPDAIVWINAAIGVYLILSLLQVYAEV